MATDARHGHLDRMMHMVKRVETPTRFDDDAAWQAVLGRDAHADGRFVFAVATTGVYCRAACPARRPRRENVAFYPGPADAERAGYRACLRCRPAQARGAPEAELVARVCAFVVEREGEGEPPTLAELGAALGLSPFHLQRTFKRATGVSPRAWARARRLETARDRLGAGAPVTEVVYAAGYGSPSRLYESAGARLGMTPATYGKGGAGVRVSYATAPCALGVVLLARTARGVCAVTLGDDAATLVAGLRARLHAAELVEDAGGLSEQLDIVRAQAEGRAPRASLPLDVDATAFQARVWQALCAIPRGETRSYSEIADALGAPTATRAVARACAQNQVALLVPCHRVVQKNGGLGGYRWGEPRKRCLVEAEAGARPVVSRARARRER